jgi:NAD(P) transhydrogenase subunit alpha
MIVGVPKESLPGERRVALVPAALGPIAKAGLAVHIETGAGVDAGYPDDQYRAKGAEIVSSRAELFAKADVILQVNAPTAHPTTGRADLDLLRTGQAVIGFCDPLGQPAGVRDLAARGAVSFSMEMIPRITRAQVMDALSSMATVAGYKAVLLAASELPRMFPMFMTAAGTVAPARVLVIGVGVAGLQAIATAKRLGAKVEAYDVRPAVKEQVESLGAKFVELPLETGNAEDKGGYARAQDDAFYRRQRELMGEVVARNDVVITTAAVPGKKAPVLVTADMVAKMAPASVIVDLAAERGGNCELCKPGQTTVAHGVTILGPLNVPATVPYHASQMYAKNISSLLLHLVQKGELVLDLADEITSGTLLTKDGKVVHPRVLEALGDSAAPRA